MEPRCALPRPFHATSVGLGRPRLAALARFAAAALVAGPFLACAAPPAAPEPPAGHPAPEAGSLSPGARDPHHRLLHVAARASEPGVYLTGTVTDDRPFDEVLPSWNVDHGGHAFVVDVRVREVGGWSPWMRIGDWNLPSRAEDVVTACDSGEVAVDVLELRRPSDACELRVAFVEPPDGAPNSVTLGVVLSLEAELDARVALAAAEPWPGRTGMLPVPTRSQRVDGGEFGGSICSPTSVAMTLEYYGADVVTIDLAHEIRDPHHGIFGNWNRAVQAAYDHGVAGELVRVSSWETVADYLRRGQPLIASIRARTGELRGAPYERTAGHLLVVTGLGAQGVVLVNDPAAKTPAGVRRSYRREDVERVWFANGGVAYALRGGLPRDDLGAETPARGLSPSLGRDAESSE